jgi:hypothetical protein
MDVPAIAKVAFTSEDRVRDVIRNFNADGVRGTVSEIQGRPSAEVHARPAAGDQEPGACPSWRTSWSPRGWSVTSATRACGSCSARRASPFNA